MQTNDLKDVLSQHKLWLDSNSKLGKRANLNNSNIEGVDLEGIDLREAYLNNTILRKANLQNADLRGTYMNHSDLSGATLKSAKLQYAELKNTNLKGANLNHSQLQYSYLQGASLVNSDLENANLEGVNLKRTNLKGTNLRNSSLIGAILIDATFSSKANTKNLAFPLTEEQIEEAIFLDEVIDTKRREDLNQAQHTLKVTLDSDIVSSFHLSYVFVSIGAVFNNFYYLTTTTEKDIQIIKSHISPYFKAIEAENELFITSIHRGSVIAELTSAIDSNQLAGILAAICGLTVSATTALKQYREAQKIKVETEKLKSERLDGERNNDKKQQSPITITLTLEEHNTYNFVQDNLDQSNLDELETNNPTVKECHEELSKIAFSPLIKAISKLEHAGHKITFSTTNKPSNGTKK